MSERPEVGSEAMAWLREAAGDLIGARRLQSDPASPARLACFVAHLAAEKALKAVLIDADIPFPKIHNLLELRRGLPPEQQAAFDGGALARLNAWGIAGRYAPDLADADHIAAGEVIELAARVVAEATRSIEGAAARTED